MPTSSPVYDEEQDQKYNPADLKKAEENPSGAKEGSGDFYKPEDSESSGSKNIGKSGIGGGKSDGDSLFNLGSGKQSGLGKLTGKFKGSGGTKKLLLLGFGGGSVFFVALAILLIMMLGHLKIVQLAEHIAAYQFARTTKQMALNTNKVVETKMGIDTTEDGKYSATKERVNAVGQKSAAMWSKFDNFRVNKILENFKGDGTLEYKYKKTALGRNKLIGVTIGDRTILVENSPIKDKLIPGYKLRKEVRLSRQLVPYVTESMKAADIGPVTRARVASSIREALGIRLTAWDIGKYTGKKPDEARAIEQKESYDRAKGDSKAPGGVSDKLKQAADDASEADRQYMETKEGSKASVNNPGSMSPDGQKIVDQVTKDAAGNTTAQKIIGVASPTMDIAIPLCLIYEGSLTKAGPSMDSNTNQSMKAGLRIQSAAAQQKDGYKVTGEAVGATDWKLGRIEDSNPEIRASGGKPDTTKFASNQASPTGQYSLADATGLGPEWGGLIEDTADDICPVLTNIWFNIGIGVGGIVASFFTGGSWKAVQGASTEGGKLVLTKLVREMFKETASQLSETIFTKKFAAKTVATITLVEAATMYAKVVVMSQMGAVHNPTSVGKDYVNNADSGTNAYANMTNQQQFYGAPMQDKDLGPDNQANMENLAKINSKKSVYERYASVYNPDSLINKLAISIRSRVFVKGFSSISSIGNSLFDPVRSLGDMFATMFSPNAMASVNVGSANSYYGNVQFGYTKAEQDLMNDDSYRPIDNEMILEQSGKEAEIEEKYGKCFDGSTSIGTMLQDGLIKRDKAGNVLADDSDCSPKNLSFNNPKYGDLVFRWRVSKSYNNTLDQLAEMQNTEGEGDTGGEVSGDVQSLAKQLLDKISSGQISVLDNGTGASVKNNLQDLSDGKKSKTYKQFKQCPTPPSNDDTDVDPELLKFLVDLSGSNKFTINALTGGCHTTNSNHYKGKAVDLGCSPPLQKSVIDQVGSKYGISDGTNEYCPGDKHWHYSIGGY